MNASLRPRVSIIITTRNNANELGYALESVLSQTFRNYEVWVIGDCCTDHSEDVVHSFSDPRILWFNLPSVSRNEFQLINEGLKRSRGEYIAYLNDGDLWLPNHLEVLVDSLEASETDLIFSIVQHVHSRTYSTLNIPVLPELLTLPDQSSFIHKKNCVVVFNHDADQQVTYREEFIRLAREENLRMDVVPITTGLKFLYDSSDMVTKPQALFIEQLKKDPDFINKQLSAILFRREQSLRNIETKKLWLSWLGGPLQKLWQTFLSSVDNAQIKILKRNSEKNSRSSSRTTTIKETDVRLMSKGAKAV
jgi:glycosyltransferase involved in cell wall biosynthesis